MGLANTTTNTNCQTEEKKNFETNHKFTLSGVSLNYPVFGSRQLRTKLLSVLAFVLGGFCLDLIVGDRAPTQQDATEDAAVFTKMLAAQRASRT